MQQDGIFDILVIDDEPPICDLLTRVAGKVFAEATFTNTRSAQDTLDYSDRQPNKWPQLILLDIDLHQLIHGFDLLPELQKRFQGQVPIIMLTTSTAVADRRKATDQGAVAFTQKPDGLQEWKDYVLALKANWHQMS